jgi:hypothetical protein
MHEDHRFGDDAAEFGGEAPRIFVVIERSEMKVSDPQRERPLRRL